MELNMQKKKIKITNEEIDSYKCEHIFDYPPVNNFCPKNIDLYPSRKCI